MFRFLTFLSHCGYFSFKNGTIKLGVSVSTSNFKQAEINLVVVFCVMRTVLFRSALLVCVDDRGVYVYSSS